MLLELQTVSIPATYYQEKGRCTYTVFINFKYLKNEQRKTIYIITNSTAKHWQLTPSK